MNFLERKDRYNIVYHGMSGINLINSIRNRKENMVPHEWYFIEYFIKELIYKDRTLPFYFVKFVRQYYPDYEWSLPLFFHGYEAQVVTECAFYSLQFKYKYDYFDGVTVNVSYDLLNKAFILGDIVTDFLIRFCDFSLVSCCNQNIILTSSNIAHKRFLDFLMKGYDLHKRAKIYFDINDDMFYKLPVFPTKDIGFVFNEFIESSEEGYEKILRFKDK